MFKLSVIVLSLVLFLSACSNGTRVGTGRPGDGASVFVIKSGDISKIQYRHLDALNVVRQSKGLSQLALSPELIAAAKTHSYDMARQNRAWHFGSDGSSPIDRVRRTGYSGRLLGENISETFEGDLQTLQAWLTDSTTRAVALDARGRYVGLSWVQQKGGKIWWTQLIAE